MLITKIYRREEFEVKRDRDERIDYSQQKYTPLERYTTAHTKVTPH